VFLSKVCQLQVKQAVGCFVTVFLVHACLFLVFIDGERDEVKVKFAVHV
jgi:hypothetical protein